MHDLYSEILDTYQRIRSQLKRDSIDPETEYEVRDDMAELTSQIAHLSDEEAFLDHVNSVLDREAARYNSGEREEPLCTCGDRLCPVKMAVLPSPVQTAVSPFSDEDPVSTLKSWMYEHNKSFETVDDSESWPPRMVMNEWARRHADAFDLASDLLARSKQ